MDAGQRQLYWFTDLKKVSAERLLKAVSGNGHDSFVVYCNGSPAEGSTNDEFRNLLLNKGIQLIEMHGQCEQVIPSIARVLKADKVILADSDSCKCDPEALQEVRYRLSMHSIIFETTSLETKGFTNRSLLTVFPAILWLTDPANRSFPPAF